jgi:hypothetical protein
MKKSIFTIIASLVLVVILNQAFAQVPQGFNYQAVARNSVGVLLQNQTLGVLLTVHQGSAGGLIVYRERQTPTTNQFGLFTVTVGQGTQISAGAFNAIDWSTGNYWLEVGLDVSGGTSYTVMGTSQLLSVPYAMYSGSSSGSLPVGTGGQTLRNDGSNWVANNLLYNDGAYIGIGNTSPQTELHLNGAFRVEANYPLMQFYTGGIMKGFIQAWGSDADMLFAATTSTGSTQFWTNYVERMRIDPFGKVGIGTTSPVGMLHINGGGSGLAFPTLNLVNSNPAGVGLFVQTSSTDAATVITNAPSSGYPIFAKYFDGGASHLIGLSSYYGAGRLDLFGDNLATANGGHAYGSVSYGFVTGDQSGGSYNSILSVGGTAYPNAVLPWNNNTSTLGNSIYKWTAVWATNGVIQTSDEALKENIKDISYGLNTIMALKPVSYQWKDKKAMVGNGNNLGFVAQDLEKVIPDVVVHNKITQEEVASAKKDKGIDITATDTYGVKYSELTPVLVKAIQEQQKIINDLQKQVDDLKALIK